MTVTAEREKALLESVPTGLLIDGEWRDASSGKTFDVKDPATGKVIASLQDANSDDAMAAFDAACAAQADWARTPAKERADILRRAYDLINERAEDFALLMTLEMGKPLAEARGEVTYGNGFLRWFSEEAGRHYGRTLTVPEGTLRMQVHHRPVGPCLLITPWNFPLAMATRKVGPAVAMRLHHGHQGRQADPADHPAVRAGDAGPACPRACSTSSRAPRPRRSPARSCRTGGCARCPSPVPRRSVCAS